MLLGGGLGTALTLSAAKVFGRDRVLNWVELPFKLIAAAVMYPFTMYSLRRFRREVAGEARAQAEEAAARERARKEER